MHDDAGVWNMKLSQSVRFCEAVQISQAVVVDAHIVVLTSLRSSRSMHHSHLLVLPQTWPFLLGRCALGRISTRRRASSASESGSLAHNSFANRDDSRSALRNRARVTAASFDAALWCIGAPVMNTAAWNARYSTSAIMAPGTDRPKCLLCTAQRCVGCLPDGAET
jgi:hypothetical protein